MSKRTIEIFVCDGPGCEKPLTSDADGIVVHGAIRMPSGKALIDRPAKRRRVKDHAGGRFVAVETAFCWECFDRATGRSPP